MRKYAVPFILFIFLNFSCNRQNVTIIEGELQNSSRDMVYLDYLDINKAEVLDSMKTSKNGSFRFKIRPAHPGIYMLRNDQGEMINMITRPGERITLKGDYSDIHKDYALNGSPDSENVRRLVEKEQDTKKKLSELDEQYGALSTVSENQASDYITRRKQIMKEQRDFSIQFIIENLNSLASIYALYQTIAPGQLILGENRDIQYMKIVADSLSVRYPDAPFVQSFVADARAAENKYYNLSLLSQKMATASSGLPDINLPDTNGDSINLSSFKGKTVLLYFWASFSQESRNLNPSLLELYKKNKKDGFEVYAVSLDKNKSEWLKAIRFDELDWVNVIDLDESASEAARIYNVKSLPASYLINKSGEVLARDIYGKELQKWLDNIL